MAAPGEARARRGGAGARLTSRCPHCPPPLTRCHRSRLRPCPRSRRRSCLGPLKHTWRQLREGQEELRVSACIDGLISPRRPAPPAGISQGRCRLSSQRCAMSTGKPCGQGAHPGGRWAGGLVGYPRRRPAGVASGGSGGTLELTLLQLASLRQGQQQAKDHELGPHRGAWGVQGAAGVFEVGVPRGRATRGSALAGSCLSGAEWESASRKSDGLSVAIGHKRVHERSAARFQMADQLRG